MMTAPDARSNAEASGAPPYGHALLYAENVFEGGIEIDCEYQEPLRDLQHIADQLACGILSSQQVPSLYKKAGLHVSASVLEAQKINLQKHTAICYSSASSGVLTGEVDTFK